MIIQTRNKGRSSSSSTKKKKRNVSVGKALNAYGSHMKKVNKKMYG